MSKHFYSDNKSPHTTPHYSADSHLAFCGCYVCDSPRWAFSNFISSVTDEIIQFVAFISDVF